MAPQPRRDAAPPRPPTAPGTIAGTFDPARHAFKNDGFQEVLDDFVRIRSTLEAINPQMRFVVTVSPVPLTATASGRHVEVATAQSKAILRAVAATIQDMFDDVEYFPSYEIITAQANRGRVYEANLRSVTEEGVATAMSVFLAARGVEDVALPKSAPPAGAPGVRVMTHAEIDAIADPVARRAARLAARDARLRLKEERMAAAGQARAAGAKAAVDAAAAGKADGGLAGDGEDAVICEEALLEAFRK